MKQICLQLQNVSDVQNWTEIASALNAGPLAGNPKGLLASKRRRSKTTRCSGEATLEMNTKARRLPQLHLSETSENGNEHMQGQALGPAATTSVQSVPPTHCQSS